MRTDLSVPFAQASEARSLGAKWDMGRKVWYVPDGTDLYPFLKWLPNPPNLTKGIRKALNRNRKEK